MVPDLITRRGAELRATARRYAATADDAEDAYQRGLEILLTKAPSIHDSDLVPWLKTVVKHEAFTARRHRDRHAPVTDDGELGDRPTSATITEDQAETSRRLSQAAEALAQLKPDERRALLLKAQGFSYAEIRTITGWTYTKVNRCLTEGRKALAIKVAGIEGGIECATLAPDLADLAIGTAGPGDQARLRMHMRSCLSCRSRLRSLRDQRRRAGGPYGLRAAA